MVSSLPTSNRTYNDSMYIQRCLTSIDVLPSKNQVLCDLKSISVFIKSCEKELIAKEYIATDMYLNLFLNGFYATVL